MEQLGLTSLCLPIRLAELDESSAVFAGSASLEASQLSAWLQKARQQPVTSLEWGVVLTAAKSSSPSLWQQTGPQLVSLLTWASQTCRQQLEEASGAGAGGGSGDAAGGGGRAVPAAAAADSTPPVDMGNPWHLLALRNTLKLSLFFLCCIAKGECGCVSEEAQQPVEVGTGFGRGQQQWTKKARSGSDAAAAAATATEAARLRRDALLAVGVIDKEMWTSRALLPAVPDLRAAAHQTHVAALHCLAHPLPASGCSDRSSKALTESCHQAMADLLSRLFVAAEERQAHAAAAQTLAGLLGVISEPKQQCQVLPAAARVVAGIMAQCSKAGLAIIAGLADCIQQLACSSRSGGGGGGGAAAGGATGVAGQQLEACLHFAALLAASSSPQLQAAMLLGVPQLMPLVNHARSSTRRLILDICSSLLPAAGQLARRTGLGGSGGAQESAAGVGGAKASVLAAPSYQALLLATLSSRMGDRDATLRAKALGCLEKHATLVAAHLSGDEGGPVLQCLVPALCSRMCDKSPSVRKKATSLLGALLERRLAPAAASRLADAALPVAGKLLGVRPDSALHPGEETAKVLCQAVLRMAAVTSSGAGLLHLLHLAASIGDEATREQLQEAMMGMLLPPNLVQAAATAGEALLQGLSVALAVCTQQQVVQLRHGLQRGIGCASRAAKEAVSGAVRLCYQRLHSAVDVEQAAGTAASSSSFLAALHEAGAVLVVLGPLSSQDVDTSMGEARLLLGSIRQLVDASRSSTDSGNVATLCWLLQCLSLVFKHLSPSSCGALASSQASSSATTASLRAVVALGQAAIPTLHTLLVSPACSCETVRRAAIEAVLSVPPGSQAPFRLLRHLTTAAASGDAEAACMVALQSAQLRMDVSADGELLPVAAGGGLGVTDQAGPGDSPSEVRGASQKLHGQQRAMLALLELLGAMVGSYEEQRTAFLQQLRAGSDQGQQLLLLTSKAGRPLRPASEWWVGDAGGDPAYIEQSGANSAGAKTKAQHQRLAEGAAPGGAGAQRGDYMHAEDEAAKHEAAAQCFLEPVLAAGDSPPTCYLPLLECLVEASSGSEEVQAAALRALGRLAMLSEPLCCRCVALAEQCLIQGGEGVKEAAVTVLADAIDAFPNNFSSCLLLIGKLMVPTAEGLGKGAAAAARQARDTSAVRLDSGSGRGQAVAEEMEAAVAAASSEGEVPDAEAGAVSRQWLMQEAAAAYSRLLLRNKLKLQGMLGPLGASLVVGSRNVAAVVTHALRQLLTAAAPKERAQICLDLFHQTPLANRAQLAAALTDPASRLLPESDLWSDVLCSQVVQALLTAASGATGGTPTDAAVVAAARLLRNMQPSSKVLSALSMQLQAGSGGGSCGASLLNKLPPTVRQDLRTFVRNHTPLGAAGAEPDREADSKIGASHKRKRATAGSKSSSAALQQQLLELLSCSAGRRAGRPPQPTATAVAGASEPYASTPTSRAPGAASGSSSAAVEAGGVNQAVNVGHQSSAEQRKHSC